MAELVVTRFLQNPLGHVAPPGQRGDIVQISDGRAKVYLGPDEFDRASEDDLRTLLTTARLEARAAKRKIETSAPAKVTTNAPGGTGRNATAPGSLTAPRRVGRRPEGLW
jgi:hypothetical protein